MSDKLATKQYAKSLGDGKKVDSYAFKPDFAPPQRLITVKDLYETTKLNLNAYLDKPDAQDFVKKYDTTYGVSLQWGIDDNYQDNYDGSGEFRRYQWRLTKQALASRKYVIVDDVVNIAGVSVKMPPHTPDKNYALRCIKEEDLEFVEYKEPHLIQCGDTKAMILGLVLFLQRNSLNLKIQNIITISSVKKYHLELITIIIERGNIV